MYLCGENLLVLENEIKKLSLILFILSTLSCSKSEDARIKISGLTCFRFIQQTLEISYGDRESDILKEVIQNANDAKSNSLLIAYLDHGLINLGIGNKENRFYTQPLLLFINDGSFSEEDSIAIASICTDDREIPTKEIDSIGKFGLGLKSLFGITDLFAWTGRTNQGTLITETMNIFLDDVFKDKGLEYYGEIEQQFLKENNKDHLIKRIRAVIPASGMLLDSNEFLCFSTSL